MRGNFPRTVRSGSAHTPKAGRWGARVALAFVGVAATGLALTAPAQAEPLWPGGPDVPGFPAMVPNPAPSIEPGNGAVVGGMRAIDVVYKTPMTDRAAAEGAIDVSSSAGVPGHFVWIDDQHVQWRPDGSWPRDTSVTVNVPGANSTFKISDAFEAVGNSSTHQFTVKVGGDVVKTMPASYGKPGHETPNGTFPVMEKFREMVMDSSTYGVPVNSKEGYKLDVEYATRLTWSGIFVHAAPWSTGAQGNSNVSHGCINLSTEDASWYFDNARSGDTVTIEG